MPDSTLQVRSARLSELDDVVHLCSEAFIDEAVLAWVIPDRTTRRRHTLETFSDSVRATVESGELVLAVTPEGQPVAASFWHEYGAGPPADSGPEPDREPQVSDLIVRRRRAVSAATSTRHPTGPHLFLSSMATLTEFRLRPGYSRSDLRRPA